MSYSIVSYHIYITYCFSCQQLVCFTCFPHCFYFIGIAFIYYIGKMARFPAKHALLMILTNVPTHFSDNSIFCQSMKRSFRCLSLRPSVPLPKLPSGNKIDDDLLYLYCVTFYCLFNCLHVIVPHFPLLQLYQCNPLLFCYRELLGFFFLRQSRQCTLPAVYNTSALLMESDWCFFQHIAFSHSPAPG